MASPHTQDSLLLGSVMTATTDVTKQQQQQQRLPTQLASEEDDNPLIALKIRTAILEHDLARANKEKDDAVRSSVLIAKILAQNLSRASDSDNERSRSQVPQQRSLESDDRINELCRELSSLKSDFAKLQQSVLAERGDPELGDQREPGRIAAAVATTAEHEENLIDAAVALDAEQSNSREDHPDKKHKQDVNDTIDHLYSPSNSFTSTLSTPSDVTLASSLSSILSPPKLDFGVTLLDELLRTDSDSDSGYLARKAREFEAAAEPVYPPPKVLKTGFNPAKSNVASPKALPGPSLTSFPGSTRGGPLCSYKDFGVTAERGGIFESEEERQNALRNHMFHARSMAFGPSGERKGVPEVFRYGVQYQPKPDEGGVMGIEQGPLYRGVLIEGLRAGIKLGDVLDKVRGGTIVRAMLLDTTQLTGGMTVFVTFARRSGAQAYLELVQQYPSLREFDFEPKQQQQGNKADVRISYIQTPSYPLGGLLSSRLFKQKQTRVLAITNYPDINLLNYLTELRDAVAFGNARQASALLSIWRYAACSADGDATAADTISCAAAGSTSSFEIHESQPIYLEFSSVQYAGASYHLLTSRQRYILAGLRVWFAMDPCARSYDGGIVQEADREVFKLLPWTSEQRRATNVNKDAGENVAEATASTEESDGGRHVKKMITGTAMEEDKKSHKPGQEGDSITAQRVRLAALQHQQVVIPTFSKEAVADKDDCNHASWADEVIEAHVSIPPRPSLSASAALISLEEETFRSQRVPSSDALVELTPESGWRAAGFETTPVGLDGSMFAEASTMFRSATTRKPTPGISRLASEDGKASEPDISEAHEKISKDVSDEAMMVTADVTPRPKDKYEGYGADESLPSTEGKPQETRKNLEQGKREKTVSNMRHEDTGVTRENGGAKVNPDELLLDLAFD